MEINITFIDKDGKPSMLINPARRQWPVDMPLPQPSDALLIKDAVWPHPLSFVVVVQRLLDAVNETVELFVYRVSPKEDWRDIAQAVKKGEFILSK